MDAGYSNPVDDIGFQQIDAGDRVYVSGNLDRIFFDDNEIEADSVITLAQDNTKSKNDKADEARKDSEKADH